MVSYNDETARTEITIQGLGFIVPQPFAEGHVLTAGEASALNQTFAENLRNNFASEVKEAKDKWKVDQGNDPKAEGFDKIEVPLDQLDKDTLQEKFDAYAAEYEFGVRRSGTRVIVDPVEREAYKIAEKRIKDALKAKNIKLDSVPKEKMEEYVEGVLAKYPEIRDEAKRRHEAVKNIALDEVLG